MKVAFTRIRVTTMIITKKQSRESVIEKKRKCMHSLHFSHRGCVEAERGRKKVIHRANVKHREKELHSLFLFC